MVAAFETVWNLKRFKLDNMELETDIDFYLVYSIETCFPLHCMTKLYIGFFSDFATDAAMRMGEMIIQHVQQNQFSWLNEGIYSNF